MESNCFYFINESVIVTIRPIQQRASDGYWCYRLNDKLCTEYNKAIKIPLPVSYGSTFTQHNNGGRIINLPKKRGWGYDMGVREEIAHEIRVAPLIGSHRQTHYQHDKLKSKIVHEEMR